MCEILFGCVKCSLFAVNDCKSKRAERLHGNDPYPVNRESMPVYREQCISCFTADLPSIGCFEVEAAGKPLRSQWSRS